MESFSEMFESVMEYLYKIPEVSEVGYKRWLSSLEPYKLENNTEPTPKIYTTENIAVQQMFPDADTS